MIEISEFILGEEAELYQVLHDAVHDRCAGQYNQEQRDAWAPEVFCQETWRARFHENREFVARLADAGHRIAGFADLQPDGYIDMFYVAPWSARRGVARALMAEIDRRAQQMRLMQLFSNVSLTARPFFSLCGFEIDALQVVTRGTVTLENARMRKPLVHAEESGAGRGGP